MMEIFKHTGEFVLEAHGRPVRSQLCVSAKIVLLIVRPALEHPSVNVLLARNYILIILEHLVLAAMLIVQFVQVQLILLVLPVEQGTTCSQLLQQQHVFPLVQLNIGRILRISFARLVMLLALLVQGQTTINALLAKRDTFCSRHQQYVLILVQMDTMELPVTLVLPVMFIVQFVRVLLILLVLPVNQGTFFQHLHLV